MILETKWSENYKKLQDLIFFKDDHSKLCYIQNYHHQHEKHPNLSESIYVDL